MLEILFEDDDLIAVNKPSGLLSQASPDPKRSTVITELTLARPELKPIVHHRLDKDTSGILLLGKSKRSNRPLTEMFREHRIKKTYLALSKTEKTKPQESFTIKNHVAPVRAKGNQLSRMVVVKSGGWYAETDFFTLEQFPTAALIQALPKTGRTHQIRLHLASLKMPILGDTLYGGKSSLVARLMLHAQKLEFSHPITQKEIVILCEAPSDFFKVQNNLRKKI